MIQISLTREKSQSYSY